MNRLAAETSPYLLQHKDNPVDWWPWGEAAFAAARASDRPVLLSIGYAACHWCHVMAHESFEDADTAALMNRLFINVKVDREERPDVDHIYQSALALMGEQGGWPLTIFVTPAGEPFWGGTYFPPQRRWGRPGFRELLTTIAELWRNDRGRITKNIPALRDGLAQLAAPKPGELPPAAIDAAARQLCRQIDPFHGGFGAAPKFPQASALALLWRAWRRTGQQPYRQAVLLTLDNLCQGGIYDHLGGGLARYATDEAWLVPHFEKMLYDNAQFIELLTEAWLDTRRPLYRQRAAETVAWLFREMRNGPAFAAALDADSEGEEGRFYVWSAAELRAILGPDYDAFADAYGVTETGNWEGHNILTRSHALAADDRPGLPALRDRVLAARHGRIRPQRDDKILADWNGLAIRALAKAGRAFGEPGWVEAAAAAFTFIDSDLRRDGRRTHSWCAGTAAHPATLDDHANLADAALALHQATQNPAWIARAEALVAEADRHYLDADSGTYHLSPRDAADLPVRPRTVHDSAVPSGNGTLATVLVRLGYLTGNPAHLTRANGIIAGFAAEALRNPFAAPTLLAAAELATHCRQLVLVGPPDPALSDTIFSGSFPNLLLLQGDPGLPAGHPAAGRPPVDGRPTAYLCTGTTCSLPITEPAALRAALNTP